MLAACAWGTGWLLRHLLPGLAARLKANATGTREPVLASISEGLGVIVLFVAVFVMSRVEKRRFTGYGLATSAGSLRRCGFGIAIGLLGVTLQVGMIAAGGGYSIQGLALSGAAAIKCGLLWARLCVLVAVFEENFFRGYLQATLADGFGFWPAALLLALGFAAFHIPNAGETWPGIAMLFCFALLAAFTLRRTGELWFIMGLHAAWDWAHVFLFSVPIAGTSGKGHLLETRLHGPQWLTGGSAGPDGSVFAFVVLAVIALLVQLVFARGKDDTGPQPAASQAIPGERA